MNSLLINGTQHDFDVDDDMPLLWVIRDVAGLSGRMKAIARLTIVLAKAPYRVTDQMVADVLGKEKDEERFVRILAWASFAGARQLARSIADKVERKAARQLRPVAA